MKKTTKFKIAGYAALTVGGVFMLIGLSAFFRAIGSFSFDSMRLFFFAMVGLPLCGVGGMLLSIGYKPEITKLRSQIQKESMDHAGEDVTAATKKTAEVYASAITEVAKAVKSGLDPQMYCKHCGKSIDADSRFCKHCAKEQ